MKWCEDVIESALAKSSTKGLTATALAKAISAIATGKQLFTALQQADSASINPGAVSDGMPECPVFASSLAWRAGETPSARTRQVLR